MRLQRKPLAYNKAYLYQNIIKYFDQASEMYKKYKAGLEKYVEEEIINKHIDNNLIELYQKNAHTTFC